MPGREKEARGIIIMAQCSKQKLEGGKRVDSTGKERKWVLSLSLEQSGTLSR